MQRRASQSQQAKASPATDTQSNSGTLVCAASDLFHSQKIKDAVFKASEGLSSTELREKTAKLLREENARAGEIVAESLDNDVNKIGQVVRSYSYIVDEIVSIAFSVAAEKLHPKPKANKSELAVLAVGGYGRSEMAPFSDVDLLFLSPDSLSPWAKQVIEATLYILWDVKLKIGQASRSVEECLSLGNKDQTIKTAMIEARFLTGDIAVFVDFDERLWQEIGKRDQSSYVQEKLDERDQRHIRQGQRYMVEPNVKEGKGGLRDLQSMYWITKYVSGAKRSSDMIRLGYLSEDEFTKFLNAHRFLWMVRCHLHLVAGRAMEQLTFDHQVELARRLGYSRDEGMRGVERFMQEYFRYATDVGELTRIYLTALEDQHIKSTPSIGDRLRNMMFRGRQGADKNPLYQIKNERIDLADEALFLSDPLNILRLFQDALETGRLIHPHAMRVVVANLDKIDAQLRENEEAKAIFLSLLLDYGNPERALRRMNELGVLGAFIPEFSRIQALMQYNTYHSYTVDEHTIQCISVLARIENGALEEKLPIVSDILKQGVDRRVLYIALLLHDIGKGLPGDHSEVGAQLAAEIAPALGMDAAETETIVWLVENHLVMSDFAQKRDISDPRTVSNFAEVVKSSSRLRLLTALTTCDIMGVGPNTLTDWKAQLLRDLYLATRSLISDGLDQSGTYNPAIEAKEALANRLSDWAPDKRDAELGRHYDAYWRGLDTDAQEVIANLIPKVGADTIVTDMIRDPLRNATRAIFVLEDHPGIFSRVTGALALAQANVIDARTYTTSDGIATSVFWILDQRDQPFEETRLVRLKELVRKTLKGEVIARDALKDSDKIKKREREFQVPTEITIDNEGSELFTIIEVDTRDRPSLLYDLSRTIASLNLSIASAVIATYGAQAVDVFYVKDMFGLKIHAQDRRDKIKARLIEAIQEGAEAARS